MRIMHEAIRMVGAVLRQWNAVLRQWNERRPPCSICGGKNSHVFRIDLEVEVEVHPIPCAIVVKRG